MPNVLTADEYLEINSVPLATPAWRVQDLSALFQGPDLKGTDRNIPHANGSRPYRRRWAATRYVFPIVVIGERDRENNVNANPRTGLIANVQYLHTNVVTPPATTAGTYTAVWRRADTTTKTAAVHVTAFEPTRRRSPTVWEFVLELSVPGGVFA